MTKKKSNNQESPQTFEVFANRDQHTAPLTTKEFQVYREGSNDVDDIFSQTPIDPDALLKQHKQESLQLHNRGYQGHQGHQGHQGYQTPQKLERIDPAHDQEESRKRGNAFDQAQGIENESDEDFEQEDEDEDDEILFENTEDLAPSKFYSLSLFWLTLSLTLYLGYQTAIAYVGFKIDHFQVVGQEKIDPQELLTFLKLKANTENFFKFDVEKVESQLKKHPWIGEYQVSKHFPNTIKIEIKEKKTRGVALLDSLMAIDENGLPFVAITPKERKDLPIISGLPKSLFDHPETKMIGQLLMKKAIYVYSLYEKSNLKKYKKLSDIYISQTGRIELMLDHTRVSLGNDHFRQRIQYLEKILSYLAHQDSDVSYILLSEDLNRAIIQESAFEVKSEITKLE